MLLCMDREVRVYNPNNHTFVQRLDHVENDPVPRFRHKREQTKRLGGGGVAWKRYKNKEVGISDLADLDGRDPGHRLEWKIHDAVVIPYRIRIRRAASMTQWDQSIRQQKKEQRETTTEPIKLALSTSPWALFAERCRAKRLLPPSLTTSSLIVR